MIVTATIFRNGRFFVKEIPLKIKDTLLCVLSDMHTGGSTALFPKKFIGSGREAHLQHQNDVQREICPTWIRLMGEVKAARKDKRLIIVNLGDAIDGRHHDTTQLTLFKEKDQADAHVELMGQFMDAVQFSKRSGDELYYVKGTETHVKDNENDMAKALGAVEIGEFNTGDGTKPLYISEILHLNINGLNNAFFHHGKSRGSGPNEGNALRNFLRDIRDEREKEGLPLIDVLWSGDTHAHTIATHERRQPNGNYHVFYGIICPSFQSKTRYAYKKVAMAINSIGGVYSRISVDGAFGLPKFAVKVTQDQ